MKREEREKKPKEPKQKVVLVFLMNSPADGLTRGVVLGATQEVSRLTRGDF